MYHSHNDSSAMLARRFYNIIKNDLKANKHRDMPNNIKVFRAAAWHVKNTIIMCLMEQGKFKEKMFSIKRSIIEFFLIIKYHFKYKKK